MEDLKEKLHEFIEFLNDKDDVFYAFNEPDKAVNEFIDQIETTNQW